ncbi:sensor domain-containing diguanylate cyclase [Pantoea agglomerans]|uniref:diguanylate cyclase n=2 Tax=Erwiniaceae TaxID=1903409 RepID=A0AAN2FLG6_ENTAG|nr:sensor domain-containing diguanylate cyclase [Pantoea agglomerans]CAH6385331.1 Diguanylate cyclase [Pantoea agglomerans]
MSKNTITLRTLLVILSLGGIIMTSVLLLGSLWFFQKANIEDRLLDSNIAYARKLSDTTDRYLFTAQRELAYSAGLLKDFGNMQQLRQEADRLRLQSGFFNSVLVVKPDAVVVATSPESLGLVGNTLSSPASRQALASRASFISRPFTSAAGNYVIFISQPVFGQTGEYLGYVGGSIYLKKQSMLSDILSTHFFARAADISIVSNEGSIIFSHDPEKVGRVLDIGPDLKRQLILSASGKYLLKSDGKEYLLGYASLHRTDWNIFVYGTADDAASVLWNTARNAVWFILLIVILMGSLVVLFAARISSPLEKLAQSIHTTDSGATLRALPQINAWYTEAVRLREAVYHHLQMMINQVSSLTDETRTDPLTGLLNRRGFATLIRQHARTPNHCAIAVDIDHFKKINDRLGHDAGDAVLISLAGLLRTACRSSDIVSRSGGEEFVIFLPDTQLPDAAATAERIRHLVETSVFPYAGQITVSAGVAALIDVQGCTEGLFRQADMALYEAKGAGRNIVIISTPEGMIVNASDSQ